jgi:hypothetical protein
MKLLRLLGNFWETHNWIYNFLRDFEPTGVMTVMSNFRILGTLKMTRNDLMLVEGVCPKMGAVSTNLRPKRFEPMEVLLSYFWTSLRIPGGV